MLERQPRAGSSYQETQVVPPGGQRRFVFETTPPPQGSLQPGTAERPLLLLRVPLLYK